MRIKAILFAVVSIFLIGVTSLLILIGVKEAYSLASHYGESTEKAVGKYKMIVVTTPSMEPNIRVGSVSIVKLVKQKSVEIRDVVMYRNKYGENIVHRVIDISNINDKIYFETKGDSNLESDGVLIDSSRYIGKVYKTFNWVAPFIKPLIKGSIVEYAVFKLLVIATIVVYLLYKVVGQLILLFRAAYYVFLDKDKYVKYIRNIENNIKESKTMYSKLKHTEDMDKLSLIGKVQYSSHLSKMMDSMQDIKDNNKAVEKRIRKCSKIKNRKTH